MNKLSIDFLYLDLSCCERCQSADEILDEVLVELRQELRVIDHLTVKKIRIGNREDEEKYGLKRSPTIRLNGRDLEEIVSGKLVISDNYCGPCSVVCGEETNCRTFEYDGETSENIPKEMLREGILMVLDQFKGSCCDGNCGCG
ncbi:MAG: DUF2703 domain-containing protein [Candidatus Thermoplasmatota archaeon]|nr:DUF2703 domain-containing protein [Candidatus Thermoplasmatota archaeon]